MIDNKYYERKIKYLDLMENGERTGGAGFVRVEVRGMEINLAVTVKGLHPTDTYERDIMLQAGDGEFAVGRIVLKDGQGQFKYHTVMDYSQLQGIRIALGGSREIHCRWQEEKRASAAGNNAVQNSGERGNVTVSGMVDRAEGRKPHRPEKLREIQLIPWDEIKTVEESLERVEQIMSRPAGKEAWNVKNQSRKNTTGEAAERAAEQTVESREITVRETAEKAEEDRAAEETAMWEIAAEGTEDVRDAVNSEAEAGTIVKGTTVKGEVTASQIVSERTEEVSADRSVHGRAAETAASQRTTETVARRSVHGRAAETAASQRTTETVARRSVHGRAAEAAASQRTGEMTARRSVHGRAAETLETQMALGGTAVSQMESGRAAEDAGRIAAERITETTAGSMSLKRAGEKEAAAGRITLGKAAERITNQFALKRMPGRETVAEEAAGERMPGETTERSVREGGSVRTGGRNLTTENTERRTTSDSPSRREKRPVRLMEDKWQQIWAIYPHIRPFQDEREYLSISPADFVLLPGEAYRAANNSFLLHGYYNYEHLILTKIEKRGEVMYYIGVPGNYYEREKQVAVMFGFESFECGTEPAQAGDFGYYMMRTQL